MVVILEEIVGVIVVEILVVAVGTILGELFILVGVY